MGYDDEGAVLTARALDDPTRPFPDIRPLADLSTVQVIGGALCLAVGALVWWIGRRFGDAGQYAGLAVGLGGAVGIVWVTRGRREPVAAQLVAFVRRRHNYCPAQDVRATRRDHRLALAMMRQYTRRGDLAGWGQYVATLLAAAWSMRPALHGLTGQPAPASSLLGGATFGEGGVAVVGGRAVAVGWVEPLILSARSPGERARLAAGWAGLADLLEPGQRLAYIADNKSADGAAVMRAIEERQQPSHNNLAAYVARRNRRWARELADSYSPAVEHYIVVDAPAGAAGDAVTHAREAVEGRLSHLGIAHRRLAAPELRGLVRAGCHLTVDARALRPGRGVVAVPRDDEERMADVAVHEHPTALHVGDRWVGSVYALRLPPKTRIDWMRSLVTLPFRTRLLVEMEGRDGLQERAALDRKITSGGLIQSSKVANQGTRDTRMSAAEEEYAALIPRLDGGMTAIVRASLIVTTDAPTRAALDMQLARVRAALRAAGCQVAGGRFDQIPLWQRSCLPLLLTPAGPDHRYRVTSESAGHLFTPQRNTPGHPSGALIGRTRAGRELVHYDWRVPATGVVLLAGTQGAGKSILAQLLAMDTLCEGNWITAVDPSGSWASLCAFVGGSYLRLASPDLPLSVWTLARATYTGDHAATVTALVKAHRAMLSGGDAARGLTPFEGGILHRGIAAVLHTAIPCERELVAWLQGEIAEASHRRGEIEDMISKLSPFTGDGSYAHLADVAHATDRAGIAAVADLDARMVVLDTAGLDAEGALLAYVVIEMVTTLRALRARERGIRARLMIDEGWSALKYALDWLSVRVARTARHLDQDAVLSTQNVSDVLRDPAAATILTAIPTVFLFRCVDEGTTAGDGIGRFRRLFGLTDEMVDALAGLPMPGDGQPSEALMVMRSRRHTTTQAAVVQVAPPAELLALAGSYASEKEELKQAIDAAGGDMLAGAIALTDRRLSAPASRRYVPSTFQSSPGLAAERNGPESADPAPSSSYHAGAGS
jgi:hypothetical protein